MSLEIQTFAGFDVRQNGFSASEAVGIAIGLRVKPVDVVSNRDVLSLGLNSNDDREVTVNVWFDAGRARLDTPSTTAATGSVMTDSVWWDMQVWVGGPRDGSSRNLKVWIKPTGSGTESTATQAFTSDNTPGQTLAYLFAGGLIGDKLHDIFIADNVDATAAASIWTSFSGGTRPYNITEVDYAWDCEGANIAACYAANKGGIDLATNPTWADPIASADNPTLSGGAVTVLRPDSTSSTGNWRNDTGGTDLHTPLSETGSPIGSSYIISGVNPVADTCKVGLSNFVSHTPTGEVIRYEYYKQQSGGTGTINLRVRVLEGSTARASWTHNDIGTTSTIAEQSMSSVEFASVTDRDNQFLEFTANP